MDEMRKRQADLLLAAGLIILLSIIYIGFQVARGGVEDNSYLAPIPQSTVDAFPNNVELKTKLQAVIASRQALNTSRIRFEQPPRVRSVVKTTLSDARKQVSLPGETFDNSHPGSAPVWLVWFEGNLRIEDGPKPANMTEVPLPFGPGCAYVIILTHQQTGTTVGGLNCPK